MVGIMSLQIHLLYVSSSWFLLAVASSIVGGCLLLPVVSVRHLYGGCLVINTLYGGYSSSDSVSVCVEEVVVVSVRHWCVHNYL